MDLSFKQLPICGSKKDEKILPIIFCNKLKRIKMSFVSSEIKKLGRVVG